MSVILISFLPKSFQLAQLSSNSIINGWWKHEHFEAIASKHRFVYLLECLYKKNQWVDLSENVQEP